MNKSEDTARVEDLLRTEPVKFVCRQDPVVAAESTPVVEVLDLLDRRKASCVILVADEPPPPAAEEALSGAESGAVASAPVGIFTERDFLDKMALLTADEWLDVKYNPIRVHMTQRPRVLQADTCLDEAVHMMTVRGYRHLPIVAEDGCLYGLLSARDVIVYLAEHFPGAVYNLPPAAQRRARFEAREGE